MTFQKFIPLLFVAWAASASADTVSVTGLYNNGNAIGQYVIGGETYWWLCIEPGPASLENRTVTANSYTFAQGWDKQNTERYDLYQNDLTNFSGNLYGMALPRQIEVMDYVLDTYLPWTTLAGASGRFAEQDGTVANFGNNDTFHNSLFAVQNFLSETYGKENKYDFTNLSDYLDYNMGLGNATADARSTIFQSILSDVSGRSAAFFDSYVAQHDYSTINSFYAKNDTTNNWQDGLVIGFAAVPEPGGAFLIACCGIAWTLRRRRLA